MLTNYPHDRSPRPLRAERRAGHLVEDVRFEHPVSGRRARRLVFSSGRDVRVREPAEREVSLFLAS